MEVIAGEPRTETEVVQHGARFKLDFARVRGVRRAMGTGEEGGRGEGSKSPLHTALCFTAVGLMFYSSRVYVLQDGCRGLCYMVVVFMLPYSL